MERLDKYLSLALGISRSDAKKMLKKQNVTLNSIRATDSDAKVNLECDTVKIDGKPVSYKKNIYIMVNKPKGVISASDDKKAKTVVDLVPEPLRRNGLFPAGRLDADTTGFVLVTDDGDFAHRILSPKNHVEKTYIAILEKTLDSDDIQRFSEGIELKDGTVCLEGKVRMICDCPPTAEVIIHEGKYHQVKRMFAALGNRVIELKRVKIGKLHLDESLKEGECREITENELNKITS